MYTALFQVVVSIIKDGINYKGQWKGVDTSVNGKVFLFKVENISAVFRGKFLAEMQKQCCICRKAVCRPPSGYPVPWPVHP
jgi:hypothetical protein